MIRIKKTPSSTPYRLYSVLSSGLRGVDGRLPSTFSKDNGREGSILTITDPFSVYQSYVRQGKLSKDEAQLRVMKEFQKLYHRLIDYKPDSEIATKQSLLLRKLELIQAEEQRRLNGFADEPIHRFKSWFRRDVEARKREVVRYMTDEEELHNISSPHGLLVNGKVGCGKSMLMDIFASSLPHESKMRWHYNNFILWVFGEIHKIQKERMLTASVNHKRNFTMENEFILFEIAQKMIERSTVFMLDEFMLPDVASAQIIRILFTYYFKLGGVLVATSNKLPEELYSSGFNKSRFKSFVGILHSRCVAVDMGSTIDYRRHFASVSLTDKHIVVKENNPNHDQKWQKLITSTALGLGNFHTQSDSELCIDDVKWSPSEICVYNRTTTIPKTFNKTICWLSFDYICKGLFSSSDYITLASTYRVFIIDDVPIMTAKMKNEARRFITLLDALYEARCQLFMRSSVAPEKMFFPSEPLEQVDSEIVQQEEMYAKTAMQTLNPYRPNVSSYDQAHAREYINEEGIMKDVTNFGDVKAFTGEDEKFAYERAVSRIHEMVASDHWRNSDKWVPVDESMRPWERHYGDISVFRSTNFDSKDEESYSLKEIKVIKESLRDSLPREISSELNIPFRQFNKKVSPAFPNTSHFWGLGEWTLDQQKRVKDKIAQAWVSGGIRNK
ncbi:hypothetical protein JCM33374_g204 [Metschnikowia sp. JCM 33374]|nr:hypothetical protein JCM33374_g204 [Metschnikowia sp. JCM 33374]